MEPVPVTEPARKPPSTLSGAFTGALRAVMLLVLSGMLLVGALILWWGWENWQSEKRLNACIGNLAQIYKAHAFYLNDHDGAPPANLQALVTEGYLAGVPRCPVRNRENYGYEPASSKNNSETDLAFCIGKQHPGTQENYPRITSKGSTSVQYY